MRKLLFKASTLSVSVGLIAVCLSSTAMAHQWDPLRRVREKAEQLRKKIECAVNDAACIEKAQKDGADVKTIPAPPGAQVPGPGQAGVAAATSAPLNVVFSSTPVAPMRVPSIVESVVVSDDGARVAGIAMRGSRYVVVIDGQDGPPFDQIGPSSSHASGQAAQGAAAFGPGGKRVAYVGVREGKKVVVIDGKEGPPFRTIETIPSPDSGNPGRLMAYFLFSDDGSRVAYVATNPAAGNPPILSQVVLDGTPGPRYAGIKQMIFAGTRHAYVALRPDGKDVLVVDGKEQAFAFDGLQSLQGNKEGHIAVLGNRNDSYSVIVDGVEGKAHPHPDEGISGGFKLAPSGKRVAYAVRSNRATGPAAQLYVDGKSVRTAVGFSNMVFSPDGTRLAGTLHDTMSSKVKVFVDEWTSLEYDAQTGPIVFSPDSKRFACVVSNGPGFVIVDGKESPAHGAIEDLQFSADSRHYAYVAGVRSPQGTHDGWTVVVDGKEGPTMVEVKRHSVTFSPDGSRVAYAGTTGFSNSLIVIDGQEHKMGVTSFKPRIPKMLLEWGRRVERWFVFSSDGKRVAYVRGAVPQGGHMVSVVDGQPQAPGHLFAFPTFSADGKRFAHIAWFNQKWFLSIDGKTAPIDGDVFEAPNSLAFQDDGSVRFLVVKDNMVHRVVATPRSGTN